MPLLTQVDTRAQLMKLLLRAEADRALLIAQIEELARIESPSSSKPAVDAAVKLVERWCTELGAKVRRHRQKHYGDVLEARFVPPRRTTSPPIMLLGHLDTVWETGTLEKMPLGTRKGRLHGPGVYDMKAGVVMALTALRLLIANELLVKPVTLLLVGDEEVGSPESRPVTEKVAGGASAVYVLEPAQGPQGAYKTARKGVGEYRLEVSGVASHSGVDFEAGHSAVRELAQQVDRVCMMTDLERGLTVNPGVIGGGTRSNVVAASAWVDIDVRVRKSADAMRIDKQFRKLKPIDPACSLKWEGGMNRPPMERTPATVRLFRRAATYASQLGFKLEEAATGGGSDGNFTSALGIPTLDGMGAVGEGAHAAHESVLIDALVPRTVLLAAMLLPDEKVPESNAR